MFEIKSPEVIDQITREALQRMVDKLNWADGGYYGWTTRELLRFLRAFDSTPETDSKEI